MNAATIQNEKELKRLASLFVRFQENSGCTDAEKKEATEQFFSMLSKSMETVESVQEYIRIQTNPRSAKGTSSSVPENQKVKTVCKNAAKNLINMGITEEQAIQEFKKQYKETREQLERIRNKKNAASAKKTETQKAREEKEILRMMKTFSLSRETVMEMIRKAKEQG